MLQVLADCHNPLLSDSLRRLFEVRLAGELYRPCGMDWYDEGFWQVWPDRWAAQQYLDYTLQELPNGATSLVHDLGYYPWPARWQARSPGYYTEWQLGRPWQGLTLAAAKEHRFDILLCSLPQHIPLFQQLQRQYQPQAKLIFQAGNNWSWTIPGWFPDVPNVMTSARGILLPDGCHAVYYHQEFDDQQFCPAPRQPSPHQVVTNLQHLMPEKALFDQFAADLPHWNWRCLGGGNPGGRGAIPLTHGLTELAWWLQSTDFLWQVKHADEGYGYNVHMGFACGKPLIVRGQYVRGTTCSELYTHGQTVIDLDCQPYEDSKRLLSQASQDWDAWSARVQRRYRQVVDFNEEFLHLKKFCEDLR